MSTLLVGTAAIVQIKTECGRDTCDAASDTECQG